NPPAEFEEYADSDESILKYEKNYMGSIPVMNWLINRVTGPFVKFFAVSVLVGTILNTLNFVILIAFAREISRIMGEEVDVTNLTRMI
ncbi:MAG: hypothetical protein ABIH99_02585, partial [Candidatus Micrarchaeota archaeon]